MKIDVYYPLIIIIISLAFPALSECPRTPKDNEPLYDKIEAYESWSLFSISEKNECWVASLPEKSEIFSNHMAGDLCRGHSQISISFMPINSPTIKFL